MSGKIVIELVNRFRCNGYGDHPRNKILLKMVQPSRDIVNSASDQVVNLRRGT